MTKKEEEHVVESLNLPDVAGKPSTKVGPMGSREDVSGMGDRGVTVVSEPDPDKCGVKKALTVGVTVMVRNEDVGIYNVGEL
ncbi:hypothetical protein AtNW77_Chr4g0282861 [Arabidopsis thaliana]|uniref:Uncharacterized protein AT4g09880 n=2 Tax=Arabidopsis TaxID=3701 RepID=Q9M0N6_ARATH|nr:uncharacterized protein AT4G09880 [Arabidopsis thaliana]AEE82809.1 hypothetical protein AT4G09880 [Arabidopsis thaliana]KAG7615424.1 hypothetical protein ISN45_At04g009830 [Arabidopsis thaliana x Arabidopsis arenosa]CAB78111.1 hypothetical protein [Arabidopsis thaliana]|eukprot:NP_192726.1 hypothetical protein AT4G09880 [Arabidopsis thaliana]